MPSKQTIVSEHIREFMCKHTVHNNVCIIIQDGTFIGDTYISIHTPENANDTVGLACKCDIMEYFGRRSISIENIFISVVPYDKGRNILDNSTPFTIVHKEYTDRNTSYIVSKTYDEQRTEDNNMAA